jgi:hypothetical protein
VQASIFSGVGGLSRERAATANSAAFGVKLKSAKNLTSCRNDIIYLFTITALDNQNSNLLGDWKLPKAEALRNFDSNEPLKHGDLISKLL